MTAPPMREDANLAEGHETVSAALRSVLATAFRNRKAMVAILGGTVLLGLLIIFLSPKVYQARASLQIDQQTTKVLGTEDTEPVVAGTDADRFLQTQVDVLNSRAIAKRVSDSLGLAANDRFLEAMGVSPDEEMGKDERLELVLDVLQKNLIVDLRRNSRVVGVMFKSRDPGIAMKVANTYADRFIENNIQRKFSTSDYSRSFLSNQLAIAKERLEGSERALIGYARDARLIDASAGARREGEGEGPRSLVTANLVQLNESFAVAQAARLQAQQRWEQARATPLMSLPDVLANDAIQRLVQRKAELTAQLNLLRERLKPEHPSVQQSMAEVAEIERQQGALAESIRNSIRNQYLTAKRQEDAIAAQVGSLKGATLAEQDRSVQYNILKREVDTNRQLYESLLQRFKEVSAEAGITNNNISIVDRAEVPRRPISPRPLIYLALAIVAGTVMALGYAFLRERFDDAIQDPADVEVKLGLPLLGVIPEDESGALQETLDDPKTELSEAYSALRTAIELSSHEGLAKSFLVTSGNKSEGKSTTSLALARAFAQVGRKVLLVDADLRRPSLHRALGKSSPRSGLSSVLARMIRPQEAVVATQYDNLSFLPAGPIPPNPANLFAGSTLDECLEALGPEHDLVILDGPPVLALADATELSSSAAATIFLIEAGGSHFGQSKNAVARLLRSRANLVGSVVTKYNSKKSGYGATGDYYRYNYGNSEG